MFLFEIFSKPCPQKQTQFGRKRAYDPSKQDKEAIQWQIRSYAPKEPLEGPIEVDITFYLPIPSSTGKLKKQQMINQVILPVTRPDVDNLAYLVTNAMKELVYKDDSQVVDLNIHKRYGETPKTVIRVRQLQTF